MRKAHLYKLKVNFNTGFKWDIDIVAINTNAVCMWITDQQDAENFYIQSVNIELVMLDWMYVKDNHLAHTLSKQEY